jgi:hypothetical protein
VFVVNHRSIDVRCLPSDSPRNFEVDKSVLAEIGDSISIKDLNLDKEKYELLGLDENEIICSVIAKKVESTESVSEIEEANGEDEGDKTEEAKEEAKSE